MSGAQAKSSEKTTTGAQAIMNAYYWRAGQMIRVKDSRRAGRKYMNDSGAQAHGAQAIS
jgi:hypothetical protein